MLSEIITLLAFKTLYVLIPVAFTTLVPFKLIYKHHPMMAFKRLQYLNQSFEDLLKRRERVQAGIRFMALIPASLIQERTLPLRLICFELIGTVDSIHLLNLLV